MSGEANRIIYESAGLGQILRIGDHSAALVVDSSWDFTDPALRPDCVGNRVQDPHEANLVDIGAKYADVLSLEQAFAYLAAVPARDARP
jgi:hypothetical protein